MEKILVTGGAGFIGSNFIRYLLSRHNQYKILNVDKLTYAGDLNNLRGISKNPLYSFMKADICNEKLMDKAISNVDVVVHFAAESYVDTSIKSPDEFVRTNVLGTLVLLKAALKHKIERFVYISTDEVYGSTITGKFREGNVLDPSNPYSASKAGAEHLVFSFFKTYGLPVLITRSSNNFGPYQNPEKFIPKFTIRSLKNKKCPLYGRGLEKRDWIFVEDNCRAIDLSMRKGKIGNVYNMAAGDIYSNIEVAKKILKLVGRPQTLLEFVENRPGHDFRYALDTRKIRKLGWKPEKTFDEGLKETIEWYKNNSWWWKSKINY